MEREAQLALAFLDTQRFYGRDPILAKAVRDSVAGTKLYTPGEYGSLPPREERMGVVRVSGNRTFQAAVRAHGLYPEARIAVLNFADAENPGRGATYGGSSQEASLCRCSTLYPALDQKWLWNAFYDYNRWQRDYCRTDACIYSPGVVICKSDIDDGIPQRLSSEKFVTVDVISCAPLNLAPSLDGKRENFTRESRPRLIQKRAEHIIHIAAENGADVLILGAFGCGSCHNLPDETANAFLEAVKKYRRRFDLIEFAIWGGDENKTYEEFRLRLHNLHHGEPTIIASGAPARERYGEAYGGQVEYLTSGQLDALNNGKQLAIPIVGGEYILFLNGPPGDEKRNT